MTTLEARQTMSDAQPTDILKSAMYLDKRGRSYPGLLKRRVRAIGSVWIVGLLGIIASIALIAHGAVNEQEKLLFGFLVLLSAAVWVAATLGMFIALWNAYVSQYALALYSTSEIVEYQEASFSGVALNVVSQTDFRRDLIAGLVAKANYPKSTAEHLAAETISRIAEKARATAAHENG